MNITFSFLFLLHQVVIQGSDDIASRAIDLLKEIYTNLGPKLQVNQVQETVGVVDLSAYVHFLSRQIIRTICWF